MRLTKIIAAVVALSVGGLSMAVPASATPVIDQSNGGPTNGQGYCWISYNGQNNLCGQSFMQSTNNIAGAGVYIDPGYFAAPGNLTISIFSNYSSNPSGLIASGTATGVSSNSGWVDVFWNAASINANTPYYMVLSATNSFMVAGYTGGNTYALGGTLYDGYDYAWGGLDLVFRTYSDNEASSNVPAPGALALLGLGLLGIAGLRRRKAA
jgi:hypothetical protein